MSDVNPTFEDRVKVMLDMGCTVMSKVDDITYVTVLLGNGMALRKNSPDINGISGDVLAIAKIKEHLINQLEGGLL